ncbi:hypothetical protein ACH4UR_25535, partial [Streptomyces lydicus]|uniref:hypothetical protein n=1 Tax=Streptomyces lydicus TaxID=47763 RepID=UPI0033F268E5
MPSPIHRSPLVTARINPAAGSATAPAAPPAEPDATPAARAEVWLSHGCDDPDIVIVWHERTQHDQDRGVTTA